MALILHFIRHGRAEHVDSVCIGHTDRPLADAGLNEIEALARRLDTHDLPCISSDLMRAHDSAERLTTGAVTLDSHLREMNFAEWDGRSWADLEVADGAQLNEWMSDWTTIRAPGRESFAGVIARVRSWLGDLPRDAGTAAGHRTCRQYPRGGGGAARTAAVKGVRASGRSRTRHHLFNRVARRNTVGMEFPRFLIVVSALGAFAGTSVAQPITVRDGADLAVTVGAPVRRVASLVSSSVDIMIALGAAGRIVARTRYDTSSVVARAADVGVDR